MTYTQIIWLVFAVPASLSIAWFLTTMIIGALSETVFQIKELRNQTELAWNEKLSVKIKRIHPNAVIPKYTKSGDAGLDVTAVGKIVDQFGNISYDTGIALEIPKGYVGLLFPRSSNSRTGLSLTNSVGVIDSSYRGSISMKFKHMYGSAPSHYELGERIGQLIITPYPTIEFQEVTKLSESDRGTDGYGSTGK